MLWASNGKIDTDECVKISGNMVGSAQLSTHPAVIFCSLIQMQAKLTLKFYLWDFSELF
jgi:hypothetical protein